MSLFSTILAKLGFAKEAIAQTLTQPAAEAAATAAPTGAPAAVPQVDVVAKLEEMAKANPEKLNWKVSIVDLMKLLGIDSSLDNRKSLAQELGYTGALDGSADMNIWLHKAVMRELAANGGKVPADLTD